MDQYQLSGPVIDNPLHSNLTTVLNLIEFARWIVSVDVGQVRSLETIARDGTHQASGFRCPGDPSWLPDSKSLISSVTSGVENTMDGTGSVW